jgi:hypothetical protein
VLVVVLDVVFAGVLAAAVAVFDGGGVALVALLGLLGVVCVDGVVSFAVAVALGAVAVPSLDLEPLPSPRKSVTYQPEPLSAKPAAVTCLVKVSNPQAVQVTRGASLILRKMSCAWWQLEQR